MTICIPRAWLLLLLLVLVLITKGRGTKRGLRLAVCAHCRLLLGLWLLLESEALLLWLLLLL